MTVSNAIQFRRLMSGKANKLGRNGGEIGFMIFSDADHRQLYVAVVSNSGGGYFSREFIPINAIESCLPAKPGVPFPAKVFARSGTTRNTNTPSFLAAVLRSLGLLGPVEGKPYLHCVTGDWVTWKETLLAMEGEVCDPVAADTVTEEDLAADISREDIPGDAETVERPAPRKGRKGRADKSNRGDGDAHPA